MHQFLRIVFSDGSFNSSQSATPRPESMCCGATTLVQVLITSVIVYFLCGCWKKGKRNCRFPINTGVISDRKHPPYSPIDHHYFPKFVITSRGPVVDDCQTERSCCQPKLDEGLNLTKVLVVTSDTPPPSKRSSFSTPSQASSGALLDVRSNFAPDIPNKTSKASRQTLSLVATPPTLAGIGAHFIEQHPVPQLLHVADLNEELDIDLMVEPRDLVEVSSLMREQIGDVWRFLDSEDGREVWREGLMEGSLEGRFDGGNYGSASSLIA